MRISIAGFDLLVNGQQKANFTSFVVEKRLQQFFLLTNAKVICCFYRETTSTCRL
jgi:hypothetical protein